MSFRTKRSAPMSQMGYNKSRVIGGKVLKYRATAPVAGSSRSRLSYTGELKNVDFVGGTAVSAGITVAQLEGCINAIGPGAGTNQRIGRRVTMKSLWVRWNYTMQAATQGSSPFRILIVYDKQNNGAATQPTALTVLSDNSIDGFKELGNEKRFTTLMDEYISPIGTAGPQSVIGQRFIKLNHEVEFSGTGSTSQSIATGAVWVYVWQNGNLTGTGPLQDLRFRIRYCE